MIKACVSVVVLLQLVVVDCEPPVSSGQYGAPPINSYGTPSYNDHHGNQDYSEPKSYEFGYQVKDDYSGNNYKRQEASDGNQVQGEYRVQLPDGRTQIVTYYADWQSGFHADVRYEGQASYPETYGNGNGAAFGSGPSNQYGAPGFGAGHQGYQGGSGGFQGHHGGAALSNQYGTPGYSGNAGFNAGATSSVSIKDYSGPGTAYNAGNSFGGYGQGGAGGFGGAYNFGNAFPQGNGGFDSYASGGFGGKIRPSATYGAP